MIFYRFSNDPSVAEVLGGKGDGRKTFLTIAMNETAEGISVLGDGGWGLVLFLPT